MALHTNRLALRAACLALQGYNDAFFIDQYIRLLVQDIKYFLKKILQYHALGGVK